MNNDTEFDYEAWRMLRHYLDIPNTDQANIPKKWYGLRAMGWTEEQCELECRPKVIDMEELMEMVMEAQKQELRSLAKYSKEQANLAKKEAKRRLKAEQPPIAPESLFGPFDELSGGLGL